MVGRGYSTHPLSLLRVVVVVVVVAAFNSTIQQRQRAVPADDIIFPQHINLCVSHIFFHFSSSLGIGIVVPFGFTVFMLLLLLLPLLLVAAIVRALACEDREI